MLQPPPRRCHAHGILPTIQGLARSHITSNMDIKGRLDAVVYAELLFLLPPRRGPECEARVG